MLRGPVAQLALQVQLVPLVRKEQRVRPGLVSLAPLVFRVQLVHKEVRVVLDHKALLAVKGQPEQLVVKELQVRQEVRALQGQPEVKVLLVHRVLQD